MKVAGSYELAAPRQQVWDALQDPAVLARTLPGCESLEVTGPGRYTVTLTAGVASVRGTYRGRVALSEQDEPSSYRLAAEGAGAPGTVQADAVVRLTDSGAGTTVAYDADAVIGGMIGGVGQRMLIGVAKKTAVEFFSAVERDLLGEVVEPAPAAGTPAPAAMPAATAAPAEGRADVAVGQTFGPAAARPGRSAADPRSRDLIVAGVVGATIALVGVLVGRQLGRGESR